MRRVLPPIVLCGLLLVAVPGETDAEAAPAEVAYPVGIRQVEFVDGERHLALAVFYPAVVDEASATPFVMPFFTNLQLYQGAEPGVGGEAAARDVLGGRGSCHDQAGGGIPEVPGMADRVSAPRPSVLPFEPNSRG